MKKKDDNMNLSGHLRELRHRVVISLAALLISFLVIFQYADNIVGHLTQLGTDYGYAFVYISPQELFLQYMKVGLIGALCIASPILMFEIAKFIAPGLKKNESAAMFGSMIFGLIFFLIGVVFAYEITIPFMMRFFVSVNTTTTITASISVANYIGMLITVFIVFGAVFELPVISVVLTQLGILRPEWMSKARPVAIVVIFVIAAVITPPDIVSQLLIAGPMIILYQFSIYLCKFFYKKKAKAEEIDEEETDQEEE